MAREAAARDKLGMAETERAELERRWEQEKALVEADPRAPGALQAGGGELGQARTSPSWFGCRPN